MANQKLTFLLDVVSGKATADLERFSTKAQTEAAKAEGGLKTLGATAKANMGPLIAGATAAGGVALVAFAKNAISSFQQVAIASGEMAAKTGLDVESASRWQEVAADLGVSGDSVSTALNKMNREAANGGLAGIVPAGKSVNEQLVAVLQYLHDIPDADRRAAEGTRLLGRGWQELAPLVDKVGELQDRLDSVSEHKIVTPEQLKQAQEMRDNIDALRDAGDELSLTVGGNLVGALNDLADVGIPVVNRLQDIRNELVRLPGPIGGFIEGFSKGGLAGVAVEGILGIKHALDDSSDATEGAASATHTLRSAMVDEKQAAAEAADATADYADSLKRLEQANKDATKAVEDMVEAQKDLPGDILDVHSAQRDLAQAQDDLAAAQRGTTEATRAERVALNDLADAQTKVADATQRIVDARERLAQSQSDDARNVERARISLANAKRDLEDAGNSNTSNGFKDAQDRVRLAQMDLDAALERQTVNARDGAQAVVEAEQDKAKAVKDAADKQAENAQKLADAQTKSADATKSAAERQRELEAAVDAVTAATLRLREAENKLIADREKAAQSPSRLADRQLAASLASAPPEPAITITNYNEFHEVMDTARVAQELDRILGRSVATGARWAFGVNLPPATAAPALTTGRIGATVPS